MDYQTLLTHRRRTAMFLALDARAKAEHARHAVVQTDTPWCPGDYQGRRADQLEYSSMVCAACFGLAAMIGLACIIHTAIDIWTHL